MNKELNELLADLRNYKDRLSIALKIADISIFEVDLEKQLFTFFENSESIFEKKGTDILHDVNVHHDLPLDAYLSAVGRGQRKQPPSTTVFTKIVAKKVVAVSTKIVHVMRRLWRGNKMKLSNIFKEANDRSELVATFLAVLELCKVNRVKIDGDGEDMTVVLNKERKSGEHK